MTTPRFDQSNNSEIITKIRELAAAERKVTVELLHFIGEMERRRCYAEVGFPSTFEFLTKELGYSESAAWRRISAAKLLAAVPETAEKVNSGAVNLTNLALAQSAIRASEKKSGATMDVASKAEVVRRVEGTSSRETDRQLKTMFPDLPHRNEVMRAIDESHVRAHVTFTNAQLEKLERLREVLSHQFVGASLADVIEAAADELLSRKDPLKRHVTARAKSNKSDTQCATGAEGRGTTKQTKLASSAVRNSKALAPSIRNLIFRRDEGKCQYFDKSTGLTCESRHFAQIDHLIPRALGGSNEPENLRILCGTHNRMMAELILGRKS